MSDFTRARGDGHLSDLAIDRLVRGELGGEAGEAARAHVAACDPCRTRLGEVEATRAAFQAAPPSLRSSHAEVQTQAPAQPQSQSRPRRRWARWTAGAGAGLAAAAALVFMLRTNEGTRVKGGSSVAFYVEHNHQVRRGAPGERVAPGDSVQLVYTASEPFYGAILSVDGARQVSRYFPDGPNAAPLEPGSGRSFPRSTQLDEVLGHETLYALLCRDAVALAPLEEALAAGRPLDAAGCRVERIEIDKRRP